MVILICFIIIVGFIVLVFEFFDKNFCFGNYKLFVIVFILIGFLIVNFGLNVVIIFLVFVLILLYLIVIVIVLIILINKWLLFLKKGMFLIIGFVILVLFVEVLVG